MNKTELVAAMAKETNLSKKDVEDVLKSFVDVVSKELKNGGKIQLVGFGTFEVSERAAREGRNPQTWHENAKIPRHTSQNPIAAGDFQWILTRNCEGTEQLPPAE